MVGFETSDDAAVYLVGDQAVLLTLDFFTPMVDSPYEFGRITAANSLSDIYAMGGKPLTAMNLLAWPCAMDPEMVAELLQGGADVCHQAGCVIVGGHTIDDDEPKYGLSVMGTVDPDRVVRNSTAKEGDVLILTKRIGVGILNTALKHGLETEESIPDVIASMVHLNKAASEAMMEVGVDAATDVTGFGILGHLYEMASAAGLAAVLELSAVPVFDKALKYSADRVRPGRTEDVIAAMDLHVDWGKADDAEKGVLCDPQTSGGLLMTVSPDKADSLLKALAERGESAASVGRMVAGRPGRIDVV